MEKENIVPDQNEKTIKINTPKENMEFARNLSISMRLIGIDCGPGDALTILAMCDLIRSKDGNPTINEMAEAIERSKIDATNMDVEYTKYITQQEKDK